MNTIHLENESSANVYKLLVATVFPRPIAWVTTVNAEGVPNLAPFSFFTVASVDPPILAIAPLLAPRDGEQRKDTLRNIRETGECVIHVVPFGMIQPMKVTSAPWPAGKNEIQEAGLTAVPSVLVQPPRVLESPIAIECSLEQIVTFGDKPRSGNLILMRARLFHSNEGLVNDFKIDAAELDLIGRLGGPYYTRVSTDIFESSGPADANRGN